jgi:glycosyltransferase involved in cell wall biosynthesis
MNHRVVCLLPARNAAADLPGFFAAARLVCDAIVALDDGSTDETGALLAGEPLVVRLLTNPPRDDYGEWDDAANRNRLLEAAAELDPEWILVLDADERIDPGDAAALRAFLAADALPGCAYGFRHVPMRGDVDHILPRLQWVYRLFSYSPGQRFPAQRLHYVPVPTSIPRARWIRTTLRIQHLGGMTTERRLARFAKYLEADPHRVFQSDYTHLLEEPAPTELRGWRPRPSGSPVLLGSDTESAASESAEAITHGHPIISAIVIARDSEGTIAQSLGSVVSQELDEPFEVIAVVSGTDRTADIVRDQFPAVTLVALDRPALPGEARNTGLEIARGQYVTFPGSHIELPPGSLAARVAAHRRGYAMVTPITLNGTTTRAGWASYFLDHHANLPGQGSAELNGAPAHCS